MTLFHAFALLLVAIHREPPTAYPHLVTITQINFPGIGPNLKGLYFLSKEPVSQRVAQMATTLANSLVKSVC